MLKTYTWLRYTSPRALEIDATEVIRVPLVVVGAGPVGLCAAIAAALRGQPVLLLDEDDTVSTGSRGLCYAQRTLNIFDRLGVGDAVVDKGVTWNVGRVFQDRFLIADVLHREAHNVWRMDFQLGGDADPEAEKQPVRVGPRIRAALDSQGFGHIDFELEWVSVYTVQCRRMDRFRHGRLLFAGDAAHQVSPFGARGANSGVQDVDDLVWKLDLVLRGQAPAALLDSYDAERGAAADENLLNSTRSTDFMTPKSRAAQRLAHDALPVAPVFVPCEGRAAQRYDARPGTVFLLRPDQHVAARWRSLDLAAVRAALARSVGHRLECPAARVTP